MIAIVGAGREERRWTRLQAQTNVLAVHMGLSSPLSALAFVLGSPVLYAAGLRWLALNSGLRSAPLLVTAIANVPLFVAALLAFLWRTYGANGASVASRGFTGMLADAGRPGLLTFGDYVLLAVPHAAYQLFTTLALFSSNLSLSFFVLGQALDMLLLPLLAACLLRRPPRAAQLPLVLLATAAAAAYQLLRLSGSASASDGSSTLALSIRLPSTDEATGLLYLLLARAAYVLRGVLSKLLLLRRAALRKRHEWQAAQLAAADDSGGRGRAADGDERGSGASWLAHAGDRVWECRCRQNPAARGSRTAALSKAEARALRWQPDAGCAVHAAHRHLFQPRAGKGVDHLELVKLDLLFDSRLHDATYVCTSPATTLSLHAIGGALSLLPTALLLSFFLGESPTTSTLPAMTLPTPVLLVLAVVAFTSCARPFSLVFLFTHSEADYLFAHGVSLLAGILGGEFFIDGTLSSQLTVIQILCIFLFLLCLITFHVQGQREFAAKQDKLDADRLAQLLTDRGMPPAEVDALQRRLRRLRRRLGQTMHSKTLLDCVLAADSTPAEQPSKAYLAVRGLFDSAYRHPPGGYPPCRRHDAILAWEDEERRVEMADWRRSKADGDGAGEQDGHREDDADRGSGVIVAATAAAAAGATGRDTSDEYASDADEDVHKAAAADDDDEDDDDDDGDDDRHRHRHRDAHSRKSGKLAGRQSPVTDSGRTSAATTPPLYDDDAPPARRAAGSHAAVRGPPIGAGMDAEEALAGGVMMGAAVRRPHELVDSRRDARMPSHIAAARDMYGTHHDEEEEDDDDGDDGLYAFDPTKLVPGWARG
eukprot:PLAT2656.1.p1 GENE.PLAT2656.1~~PLAT2656.1.p1  ORF type:complete len:823 (+),score=401.30 PLAT2656.1:1204-3672(+)